MTMSTPSHELQEQLDEFFHLLGRAQNLFPTNPVPPPTVNSGVVHNGQWIK
jgi:hypothetical protein